jgi:hypothetical protein
MKKIETIYNGDFYNEQSEGSKKSAKIILGLLLNCYNPKSMVDFGCGIGTWLNAGELYGIKTLKGYDGSWVKGKIISENIDFTPIDFEDPKVDIKKYDLAISMEVAEHLSTSAAINLVRMLCLSSDVVLFSAAIKNQGGTNHINENAQSYWINLFKEQGFECLDVVRPGIWNNADVEWWYRQNIFLFLKTSASVELDLECFKKNEKSIYDVVHPDIYEFRMSQLAEKDKLISQFKQKLELMEGSKFWKIRNFYIKIRNKMLLK